MLPGCAHGLNNAPDTYLSSNRQRKGTSPTDDAETVIRLTGIVTIVVVHLGLGARYGQERLGPSNIVLNDVL
jgi:hypothetical protein